MANVPITDLTALTTANVAVGDTLVIVDVSEALDADKTKKITLASLFGWRSWTPTFGGFSSDPSVVSARYCRIGNMCWVRVIATTGTSNANTFTMSAPVAASVLTYGSIPSYIDNGTAGTGGVVSIEAAGSTFTLAPTSGTATGWTTSGSKGARFIIFYEAA